MRNDANSPLLCLFISAKKNYHKREFLNVLCLPEGAHVVVAYSMKWIPEYLRDEKKYVSREALVSFCELQKDGDTQTTALHPARWVDVVGCVREPAGYVLTLKLGRFQSYENADSSAAMVANFNAHIKQIDRNPTETDPANPPPYFILEAPRWQNGHSSEDWVAITEHMKKRFALDSCTFFRISGRGKDDNMFPVQNLSVGKHWKFNVPSSSSNQLQLQVIKGVRKSDLKLPVIEISASVGTVIGPIAKQFSEGLEFTYNLHFGPQIQAQESMIRVSAVDKDMDSPEFGAFITVKPEAKIVYLVIFLLCVAQLLAAVSSVKWCDIDINLKLFSFLINLGAFTLAFKRLKLL